MKKIEKAFKDYYASKGREIVVQLFSDKGSSILQWEEWGRPQVPIPLECACQRRVNFIPRLIEQHRFKDYQAYKDFIEWDYIEFEWWYRIPSVNWQLRDSILCGLALANDPAELLTHILK